MEFHVYETGQLVKAKNRPIVIITSNEVPSISKKMLFSLHPIPRARKIKENCESTFP